MAQLWQCDEPHGDWIPSLLDGSRPLPDAGARIERARTPSGEEQWVLLGPSTVRLNGSPLATGIALLRDRDEIAAGGRRVFFGTERLATIAVYEGTAAPLLCPRCKLDVETGSATVRCPSCGVLHHQTERLPCWRYAERCAVCEQPTALDAGYRWTPEGL